MSGVGESKYHVIQFLEAPYKDIAEFVCVPRSWVQSRGPGVPVVKVSYPVEEPSLTEERVVKCKKKMNSWKSYISVMRYSTDNYENAKFYIQQEINKPKNNKGDQTLLSAKASGKTSISTQNATSMSRATIENDSFVVGMIDALGWRVSSKSASAITLKRKALPVPDMENCNKRFRAKELDESDNQVAGPSSKAFDWSSKNHLSPSPEDSDEDLCTQEIPMEKINDNSTEMRQTVNQNPSKTSHSLDPKIIAQLATSPMFAKWCMLMQELQEIFDNSMFKELINKLLNKDNDGSAPEYNDPIASTSSDTTVKAPKLNKEKRNEKPLEMNNDTDNDDDKDQPLDNDDSSEEDYSDLDEDEELPPGNVELVNKDNDSSAPQKNYPIASTSSDTTVKAPKFNKEKRNEKPLEMINDTDNDDDKDQPLDNDDSSEEDYSDLDEDEELPPGNVELVNKDNDGSAPQKNDPIASTSSDTTVKAPKFNKEKRNEKPLEMNNDTDNDDDKDQPLDNDDSSEEDYFDLDEDEELPPEYDANDSRWTLKYRKPARQLVELMPHTGVYVSKFHLYSSRPIQMAKELLLEIFTQNALNVCRLPGIRAKAVDRDGTKVRPALDEGAITVLMNIVTENAKEDCYPFIDNRIILKTLRYEMGVMRRRVQIERNNNYKDNDDSSEDGYCDWDEDEELPPEFDANDSRWTLKYREPAPGNVELMPHTGVYVTNYKILPKRPIPLANMLLRGIFTRNALNICWLTGTRAKAINRHGTKVRPALNEHAISVLLKYVTDHAIEYVDSYYIQVIIRSMRNRMRNLRGDALHDIKKKKNRLRI